MTKTFPFPMGTIHIVGIAGIGMSGYAEVLHKLGYAVQGSDQNANGNTTRLRELGVRILTGHDAGHIKDADGKNCVVVVRSTAIRDDNIEVTAAQDAGIPVIPRVELLAELMRNKWCINISGTHGKTTTTSMVGWVLEQAGLDPTVINGGIINAYKSNTRLGSGPWMVVESDESDGTFARLPSVCSVITNIDPEHLDFYGSFEALKKSFISYIDTLPFYGVGCVCIDHPVVRELLPEFKRRILTYGESVDADIRAVNIRTTPDGLLFDLETGPGAQHYPDHLADVHLPMFGHHNVANALAAFAVAHDIGVEAQVVAAALAEFEGVKRRFTTTGIVDDITIIDDYGHHPVEIATVLKAGRDALAGRQGGRLVAVVQPHRYTRLENLFSEFCDCVADADTVIVADVYEAGEKPIEGVSRDALVAGIKKTGKDDVHALRHPDDLPELIHRLARPGDFVICLGAGNITQWAAALPDALAGYRQKNGTTA